MCRTYGAPDCFCVFSQPSRAGLTSAAPLVLGIDPPSEALWAVACEVLPVAECFTAGWVRVSVFSRTAIHAPGGWALIENLPHVLTGDRVTVGLTSTYLLPHRKKHRFSLHGGVCASTYHELWGYHLRQRRRFVVEIAVGLGLGWYRASGGVGAQPRVAVPRGQRGHLA